MGHYMFNHLRLPVLVAFGGFAIFTLSLFGSISIQKSAGRCFFSTLAPSVLKRNQLVSPILFLQWDFCNDIFATIFNSISFSTENGEDQWKILHMNEFIISFKIHRWLRRFSSDFRLPSYSWANWPVLNNEVILLIIWINPSTKRNCITN